MSPIDLVIKGGRLPDGTTADVCIDGETIVLESGQSIKINKQTRVQYSNPFDEQCEYMAICMPAFSMDLVNREEV